ncbi:DUF4968 domain-containing protein [Candidatus Poribacteria bacterium]|nr:DUF4968 domain-containing protein [Candidatus Poribacteria bacterium]
MPDFQPESTPIFAHPDRTYHYLETCSSAEKDGSSAVFGGVLESGREISLVVSVTTPNIIRVRYDATGGSVEHETPFIVRGESEPPRFEIREDSESYSFDTGAVIVHVIKSPWQMSVTDSSGNVLFQQEVRDKAFVIPVTYPTGFSEGSNGSVGAHENFSLLPDEHLFGLGPKGMSFNKRGTRSVMWCSDTFGTNTTELSYISIPFFVSSRGYGLFLNSGAKSIFELGSYSAAAGSVWVDSPLMDYFLIFGKTPAEIISGYTWLTGRPPVPPKWAFGLWMSRCWYFDRPTIESVVERMRSLGIPLDVVNIDPAWLKDWPKRRRPGCEFEWNTADFPDPEGFLRELREKNVRVCLWENPYVPLDSNFGREGERKGYLAKNPDGSVAEPDHPICSDMGLIDYSNPHAVEWVKEAHRRLMRQGVAAFKTDYGEGVPESAVFHNGKTGREMHNVYPLLYNRAVHDVIREVNGEAIVFGRSGTAGSQRYPIQWAGDSQSTFSGMAAALRGGLSYSLSGGALWSHDIGGFVAPGTIADVPPSRTLYIRWAQFGLLSPVARFHGRSPREPWEFGEDAVRIVRKFALLRSRLIPYIYSCAHEASRTGMPIMRPLYLEFPDDPHAPHEDLEYLLGRELLIAPVFNEVGERTVYLPAGEWTDFWTGSVHAGPVFLKLNVPLDSMPIYVREDSILPLCKEMQHVEEQPWDEVEVHIYLKQRAAFSLFDGSEQTDFEASRTADHIHMAISQSTRTYHVVLHGLSDVEDIKFSCNIPDLTWEHRLS